MQNFQVIGLTIAALLLLFIAFSGFVRRRRQQDELPEIGNYSDLDNFHDEILNIKKINAQGEVTQISPRTQSIHAARSAQRQAPSINKDSEAFSRRYEDVFKNDIFIVNIFAKPQQFFAGYDLLQALLESGMRFGEMDIFHHYQNKEGNGPVLFSLASATEPGTFNMQQMSDYQTQGLTLFMRLKNSPDDVHTFDKLCETAMQLSKALNGQLLSQDKKPFGEVEIIAYHNLLLNTH